MKANKKEKVVTELTKSPSVISNIWVEPMLSVTNPKIQNHPKFKELTAGAKNFAALILETTPPGNDQKLALEGVGESYRRAISGFTAVGSASI